MTGDSLKHLGDRVLWESTGDTNMTKQQLIQKARAANRDIVAHVQAGRFWAADLAANTRDAAMADARRA